MEDFQRYMEMQGVQPLNSNGRAVAPTGPKTNASPVPREKYEPAPAVSTANLAYWTGGAAAREAFEHALSRVKTAEDAWLLGIGQTGGTVTLDKRRDVASLISAADRMNLKLIIMGAPGWSSVFHPGMGAATLDRDPA